MIVLFIHPSGWRRVMEFKYDVEGLCGLGIVLYRCGGERAAYNPHF